MNIVEPIRDKRKIENLKVYLKGKDKRSFALFTVGINIALRIADLLDLKWKDVLKENKKTFKDIEMDDFIFKSREGENKSITRQHALNILKDAAKAVGVTENVGTHSLRKTWGYHAWKTGFNPAIIMETLNHSNLSLTKRYLGIQQDDVNELYDKLNL